MPANGSVDGQAVAGFDSKADQQREPVCEPYNPVALILIARTKQHNLQRRPANLGQRSFVSEMDTQHTSSLPLKEPFWQRLMFQQDWEVPDRMPRSTM
jgi:hypothetical protein